jgi:RecA-family ATPase
MFENKKNKLFDDVLEISDFISKYEDIEPNWLVPDVLETGTINMICADGGKGKTWLLLDLYKALSSNKCWLNHFELPMMKTLYIDRDMSPTILSRRLLKLNDKENYKNSLLSRTKIDLSNAENVEDFMSFIKENKFEVIMIDALYKITGNFKENDNDDMAVVMSIFDQIRELQFTVNDKLINPTIFIIHHSSKSSNQFGSDVVIRGASSIKNGCDNVFTIDCNSDKSKYTLRSLKLRESDGSELKLDYCFVMRDENIYLDLLDSSLSNKFKEDALKERIMNIFEDGMNQSIIRQELRENDVIFDDKLLKTVLENMTEIKCVKGPRNSNVYYLNG